MFHVEYREARSQIKIMRLKDINLGKRVNKFSTLEDQKEDILKLMVEEL